MTAALTPIILLTLSGLIAWTVTDTMRRYGAIAIQNWDAS